MLNGACAAEGAGLASLGVWVGVEWGGEVVSLLGGGLYGGLYGSLYGSLFGQSAIGR